MHKITASSDRLMHVMQLVSSAKKPVSVAELAELSGCRYQLYIGIYNALTNGALFNRSAIARCIALAHWLCKWP